jgi:hypothetical protein
VWQEYLRASGGQPSKTNPGDEERERGRGRSKSAHYSGKSKQSKRSKERTSLIVFDSSDDVVLRNVPTETAEQKTRTSTGKKQERKE